MHLEGREKFLRRLNFIGGLCPTVNLYLEFCICIDINIKESAFFQKNIIKVNYNS